MAKKQKEKVILKKGASEFTLVGRAKVNDYTFTLDKQSSKSDWVGNFLNIGIDCGGGNVVYAGMMAGYKSDTQIRVHGKKLKDGTDDKYVDDFKNAKYVDWDKRFDDDVIEFAGAKNFIKVGIEKDTDDKTVTKYFLSEYDAIAYLEENKELIKGNVVRVSGNLKYQNYNGEVQTKKEINSIFISKIDDEEKFKAEFKQSILVDKGSIGKKDSETNLRDIDARVIDYNSETKSNIPFNRMFKIENENLTKLLKSKKDINEIIVIGDIIEGTAKAVVEYDDLDDDIKYLVDSGMYTLESLAETMSTRGEKTNDWIIRKPEIRMVGDDDQKVPQIQLEEGKYTEDDLFIEEIIDDEIDEDELSDELDGDFDDEDLDDFLEDL